MRNGWDLDLGADAWSAAAVDDGATSDLTMLMRKPSFTCSQSIMGENRWNHPPILTTTLIAASASTNHSQIFFVIRWWHLLYLVSRESGIDVADMRPESMIFLSITIAVKTCGRLLQQNDDVMRRLFAAIQRILISTSGSVVQGHPWKDGQSNIFVRKKGKNCLEAFLCPLWHNGFIFHDGRC